jgi:hypothetical protein
MKKTAALSCTAILSLALLAGCGTSSAQSPTAAARQTLAAWNQDIYTNNPQACNLSDAKGKQAIVGLGRFAWEVSHPTQLKASYTNPQIVIQAVPNCTAGVTAMYTEIRKTDALVPSTNFSAATTTGIKNAIAKVVNSKTVTLNVKIQLGSKGTSSTGDSVYTLVLLNGHWLVDNDTDTTSSVSF